MGNGFAMHVETVLSWNEACRGQRADGGMLLQVVLALGEHLRELMVPFDPWADPAHQVMQDISWRRSAIEFLPQVKHPCSCSCGSMTLWGGTLHDGMF